MPKISLKASLLVAIILISAFLRLYRLSDFMTYLGDEGRDAIIVKRIVVDHKFTLLGPATSIGNMYLGPLYYYFMVIPIILSNLDPIGPAAMVSLFGVLTVFLVYKVGKEWFGEVAGLVASALYAVSPSIIANTRSSWNPNPMPLFSLILVYSLYKTFNGNSRWIIPALGLIAVVLQLHYMSLFLIPLTMIVLASTYWSKKDKLFRNELLKNTVLGIALFLILFGPFILFELRHDFLNIKALFTFIRENQNPSMYQRKTDFNIFNSLLNFIPVWEQVFHRIIPNNLVKFANAISLMSLVFSIYYLVKSKIKDFNKSALIVLFYWMAVGVIGVSFYRGVLNDHYIGFLFPTPFLLIGFIAACLWKGKKKILISVIIIFMFLLNLRSVDIFTSTGDKQLERTKEVVNFILQQSNNESFNFALISDHNYDDPYLYFFEIKNKMPLPTHQTITDQLFVVCEGSDCQPVGNPKWGIASFGWSKIDNEWQLDGRKVFKLVHLTPSI